MAMHSVYLSLELILLPQQDRPAAIPARALVRLLNRYYPDRGISCKRKKRAGSPRPKMLPLSRSAFDKERSIRIELLDQHPSGLTHVLPRRPARNAQFFHDRFEIDDQSSPL
jgi:hypothetical protein